MVKNAITLGAVLTAAFVVFCYCSANQFAMPDSFKYRERECNVLYSLTQYGGDCEIHMIHQPTKGRARLHFKFRRDNKDIVVLDGHRSSVFLTSENILFFAHFSPNTCGCAVAAYDLDDGKMLWKTKLKAVGTCTHSQYWNSVSLGLAPGIVSVSGRETLGDYIECLDQKTGKVLGHKIYSKKAE